MSIQRRPGGLRYAFPSMPADRLNLAHLLLGSNITWFEWLNILNVYTIARRNLTEGKLRNGGPHMNSISRRKFLGMLGAIGIVSMVPSPAAARTRGLGALKEGYSFFTGPDSYGRH